MTSEAIHPELEEILAVVARDPDAKLFLTTPRQLTLGLRGVVHRARERQPDLSHAERHLLAVHREELGELLMSASLAALQRNPKTGYSFHTRFKHPPPPEEWTRAFQRLAGIAKTGGTLEFSEVRPSPEFTSAHKLALLAMRIRPHPVARLTLSLATILELRLFSYGRVILRPLAEGGVDDQTASCALTNLGLCHDLEGNRRRALEFYQAAARRNMRVSPLVSGLVTALSLGDSAVAVGCAKALNDLAEEHTSSIEESIRRAAHRKKTRMFRSDEFENLLAHLQDQLGRYGQVLKNACS